MKRVSVVLGVSCLIGCGGSSANPAICDALASAESGLAAKAGPCMPAPPALPLTAAQCRATISMCGSGDAKRVANFTACLDQLPTCSPATAGGWSTSLQACGAMIGPLAGQGC